VTAANFGTLEINLLCITAVAHRGSNCPRNGLEQGPRNPGRLLPEGTHRPLGSVPVAPPHQYADLRRKIPTASRGFYLEPYGLAALARTEDLSRLRISMTVCQGCPESDRFTGSSDANGPLGQIFCSPARVLSWADSHGRALWAARDEGGQFALELDDLGAVFLRK